MVWAWQGGIERERERQRGREAEMASRGIFVFTILLSLVLVSCRHSRSPDTANRMIDRACRKTNDFGLCVSTLKSDQRTIAAHPKPKAAITKFLAEHALSQINEATAYIEKVFYDHQDMVVKQYFALCLDDYAKAEKKLKRIEDILASSGNYKKVLKLMRATAGHAAACQEAFERKKLQSEVYYMPPRPCPLSQQNKIIQLMADAAKGLLARRRGMKSRSVDRGIRSRLSR